MNIPWLLAHAEIYADRLWLRLPGRKRRFYKDLYEDSAEARREHFLLFTMGGEMGGV